MTLYNHYWDSETAFWKTLYNTTIEQDPCTATATITVSPSDLISNKWINGQKKPDRKPFDSLSPVRIQKNGPAMIVFWKDGTKTIVKRGDDEPDSDYAAFTAALGIKVFGTNSQLKKIVSKTETQKPKKQKPTEQADPTETVIDQHDEPVTAEEAEQKSETLDALKAVAEKFGMTVEEAFRKIKEAQKYNKD